MPTGAIIILVIIVWLFVLAPLLLRSQRPVAHTREAFEDTRVLFTGDSGAIKPARRPNLRRSSATEFHAEADAQASQELMDRPVDRVVDQDESVEVVVISAPAIPILGSGSKSDDSHMPTIDGDVVADTDTAEEAYLLSDESKPSLIGRIGRNTKSDAEETIEFFAVTPGAAAEDAYQLDETFTSPVDLMYPGALDTIENAEDTESAEIAEASVIVEDGEDGAAGEQAQAENDLDETTDGGSEPESLEDELEAEAISADSPSDELSDEELEFAQHRSGRGGWDPVAEKVARATRYQRRQRTLMILAALAVVAVALGIIVRGWAWLPAVILGVVIVMYLVALRNQTLAEQQLRRRRIEQLRRARLGVKNAHDEELAIPRKLRRPGAIVLEADDESPDFEFLPVMDGLSELDDSELSGMRTHKVVNRRNFRDELSERRVG